MMEVAHGAPTVCTAPKAKLAIGTAPRRSDRYAISAVSSQQSVVGVVSGGSEGVDLLSYGCWFLQTAHVIRAILLASATAALLCPRRPSRLSAQSWIGSGEVFRFALQRTDRAPCTRSILM